MGECVIPNMTSIEVVESKSVLPEGFKAAMGDLRAVDITQPVLELIRRTTSRMPQDIIDALVKGRDAEEEGSRAFNTLNYMIFAREANRPVPRLAVPIAGDNQEAVQVAAGDS